MDTVPWNRVILEEFCSLAILTPLEEQKVIAGVAMYIEKEILPRLPEMKALAVAGVVALQGMYRR